MLLTGAILLCGLIWLSAQSAVVSAQVSAEVPVLVDRAILAYEEQRYEQALRELQEALRLDPDNIEALYYQGLVYIALARPADALASWERAHTLRPADLDVTFQLGALAFAMEDYDKAVPLLRHVYAVEPNRPNLGYYLGFMAYRQKNYRQAIDLLRANVPSDENFAQLSRFYAGLSLSALGFPQEARSELEEALRLQPVSPLTLPAQRFGEALERVEERQQRFSGEVRIGLFYDSNVTVVPNASSDLVAQVLREDQQQRGSAGELATLNLSYTWLRSLDWEGTLSYRFLQTYNNQLTDFNVQNHTPTLGAAYRHVFYDMLSYTGLQLTSDFIMLGDTRFVQRWIINPYLSLFENAGNLTTLQLRFQLMDFFNPPNMNPDERRDGVNYMIGPLHFFLYGEGRHYLKLGYQYDYDATEGNNWDYTGHRLLAGAQYTLPWWDIRLRYDLDFHVRSYANANSLIPVTAPGTIRRKDHEAVHLFSVGKDFMVKSQRFTAALEYLYDDNRSNLDPYAYDRQVVTSSLTWRF
jgi:tetratricopeptide (TPR) repeat protein